MAKLTKEQLYKQLKRYLAIKKHGVPKDKLYKIWKEVPVHARGVINAHNNRYYPVMWMPRLERGWRRLKYEEFKGYYWG